MSDEMDRAQAREEEMRSDAMAALARRADGDAGRVSASHCRVCDDAIPLARQIYVPGVQTCVECQTDIEKRNALRGAV